MILPGIAAILAASVSVAARMAAISGVKGVRMVKNRWWGFLLLVASAVGLFACTMPTEADEIAAGRQVYTQNCAICHQPDGEGYAQVFPHLAGNPIVMLHNPEPVIEIVLNGRGSMPAFRDQLTLEERAQVISYIRTAWGNKASTVSRTQAK